MRLDKYLKVSRIIKRRTVAKEACDKSLVEVNGNIAKSSTEVKEGDIIKITFGERVITYEIKLIKEHVLKNEAKDMYEIISQTRNYGI